jgi:hypothetical protein
MPLDRRQLPSWTLTPNLREISTPEYGLRGRVYPNPGFRIAALDALLSPRRA